MRRTNQRYVSNELTHFVGRDLLDDEVRYALLLHILNEGELRDPRITMPGAAIVTANPDPASPDPADMSKICFCDIPNDDLSIHVEKYSRFGLSFKKGFLIERGANPVFYVVENAVDRVTARIGLPQAMWETIKEQGLLRGNRFKQMLYDYQQQAQRICMPDQDGPLNMDALKLHLFIQFHILGHIKFFREGLSENDPCNYYMEREWRVVGCNMTFALNDVWRVILPENYSGRFRNDLPRYAGQVTFAE